MIIFCLNECLYLFFQEDITDTCSIKKQTKKGLGSYMRYVSSTDCILSNKNQCFIVGTMPLGAVITAGAQH